MRQLVTLLCVLGFATPASAEPIGFFASLQGDVQVAAPAAAGAFSWQAAQQDGGVQIGDHIKTGPAAAARILLVDDTLLQVDEDTELEIQTFHVGAAATKERSIVRHTRGRLRTMVGNAFGGETRLEVHTPTAVVGVKGTDFETRDASLANVTRFRMCLHGGAISVSNDLGGASPRPGYCVFAEQGQAPGAEFRNPDAPFEAPKGEGPDPGDFSEPVSWPSQPGPAKDDLDDSDELRVFELPEPAPVRPNGPPVGFTVLN